MKNANEFSAPRIQKNGCISDDFAYQKQHDQLLLAPQKFHRYTCLAPRLEELPNQTLVFNVEETLLKFSSWFPLFMLVAFEGGGILRALLLLMLYPLVCIMGQEWGLKVMVFVSFFGVKRSTFRLGRTVLPKFLLENVGYEGFELAMRFGKRAGVSNLPRVMVQAFLSEYLGIEHVFGKEIKVFKGYYLGLMEGNSKDEEGRAREVREKVMEDKEGNKKSQVVGLAGSLKTISNYLFTNCKDIYLVSEADKEKWHYLPRDKYPKPMIFHDGRLAFWPTPLATLVMFIWLPFGILLCIARIIISQFLPYNISIPLLAFLGTSAVSSIHKSSDVSIASKGVVYVCNHKTLLDPIYISFICRTPLTALTYSVSKTSQLISPIKTITLTRNRQRDTEIMHKALRKGSIAVCPEGTTCREPYLLRFSPLFAEISNDIVPVAMDVKVSMFYGTTATGIKALDPIFFLMNPYPFYIVKFLEKLPKSHTCEGAMSKFDVANCVQGEIAKALGFTCTDLTRKDKYLMLAGNTGIY